MQINKDTKLFGSFSNNPGNNGCLYFNNRFQKNNINAIYTTYYGDDPEVVVNSTRALKFKGFALSMPLKVSIIPYLDIVHPDAQTIGAVNTVINRNNIMTGYNTDWLGVKKYFLEYNIDSVSIIGNGGFSKAIQYCCTLNNFKYEVFTRENIDQLLYAKYKVFNATPADFKCDIDGRPNTDEGKYIASLQAEEQYKLYIND